MRSSINLATWGEFLNRESQITGDDGRIFHGQNFALLTIAETEEIVNQYKQSKALS